MEKTDFYKILCTSTPEELNQFLSSKGKKKIVNAVVSLPAADENSPQATENNQKK